MNSNKFFYRNVIFSKEGKTISLIDINNPSKKEKLEAWFGVVFQLADGQHTIEQLHKFVATQYSVNPPSSLKQTLDSVVERLIGSKLIVLADEKTPLPYYLSMPYELLNVEKAKKLLLEDSLPNN